jgi:hypothetical protein
MNFSANEQNPISYNINFLEGGIPKTVRCPLVRILGIISEGVTVCGPHT